VPKLGSVGQDQRGEQSLRAGPHEVRREHQALTFQPVGPDAPDEEKPDERDAACGQDEPERGR